MDRRSEPRMLGYNPIQRHELKKKMTKFEENYTKIEDMRVPHWKTAKKAVMTSSKQNFQYLRKNTFSFQRLGGSAPQTPLSVCL